MTRPLTKKQQAIYDYIRDRILVRGYGPTVREIGEEMGIKSPNGVVCHLRALQDKGVITRTANKSRSIELTESLAQLVRVPLAIWGIVNQRTCLLDKEAGDEFDLATVPRGGERFGLRVTDDSLLDQQIRRGDLVIVQSQSFARPGQLVVSQSGGRARLSVWQAERAGEMPRTGEHPSTSRSTETGQVTGVVVGVIRDLQVPFQARGASA